MPFAQKLWIALPSLAMLTLASGCGKGSSGGSSPPPPQTQTQTFTGTVPVGGSDFHTFNVTQNVSLAVDLTATAPAPNVPLGVALGVPDGSGCSIFQQARVITFAGASPQLMGTSNAGPLCVEVYDAGGLTTPINYTVTVAQTPTSQTASTAARFTVRAVSPAFFPVTVKPVEKIMAPPVVTPPRPFEVVSPQPPTYYVPLDSAEGLQELSQEHDMIVGSDRRKLTPQDQMRPHGSPTVIDLQNPQN